MFTVQLFRTSLVSGYDNAYAVHYSLVSQLYKPIFTILFELKQQACCTFCTGKSIEEDVIIMTEVERAASPGGHDLDVQYAITKLLQDELGLDVRSGHGSRDELVSSSTALQTSQVQPRRPHDLGVLKVTKESLLRWLQKKWSQSQ